MTSSRFQIITELLKKELIPAYGCTEPIAIAYAAAKAREVLGCMPSYVKAECSGNIIKNVRSVTVPSSGGLHGIEISALLGIVGGNASKKLEVLTDITPEESRYAAELQKQGICKVCLLEKVPNLDIIITVYQDEQNASVEIRDTHTNITRITKNGAVLYENSSPDSTLSDLELSLEEIYEYANCVEMSEIKALMLRQLHANLEIAQNGLKGSYGANVGQTIMRCHDNDWINKAVSYAAAGSDARMGGCSQPVVINSGSGNQGLTVSMPVYIYAEHIKASDEQLVRALVFSNLTAIYQKSYIGKLSAYCGVVSAAVAAGAAITYLAGGTFTQIGETITNAIACLSGIICDGAKPSCAAKIATSVYAAIMSHYMAMENHVFQSGEGLVSDTPDDTIRAYTTIGRDGMAETDITILKMMLSYDASAVNQ